MKITESSRLAVLGVLDLATIIMVILKLTGVVTFSWFVVFSPFLVPLAATLVMMAGMMLTFWVAAGRHE